MFQENLKVQYHVTDSINIAILQQLVLVNYDVFVF